MNDHGNDWSCWVWTEIAATCTEAGFEGWICKYCDEEDGETIPALEHDWNWEDSYTYPTCSTDGYWTPVCDRCGELGEVVVDHDSRLGHIEVLDVALKSLYLNGTVKMAATLVLT